MTYIRDIICPLQFALFCLLFRKLGILEKMLKLSTPIKLPCISPTRSEECLLFHEEI